jgi:hypothetical protein
MRENSLLFHNCIQHQPNMQETTDLDPAEYIATTTVSRTIPSSRRIIQYTRNRSHRGMLGTRQRNLGELNSVEATEPTKI